MKKKKRLYLSFSEEIISTAKEKNISLGIFKKKFVLVPIRSNYKFIFGLDIQKGYKHFGVLIRTTEEGWTEVLRRKML